jgi:hypothetical protein
MAISKTTNAPLQTAERPSKVLFTKKSVRSSEASKQVPKGCRMASSSEVSSEFKTDTAFRERLYLLHGVWAAYGNNEDGIVALGLGYTRGAWFVNIYTALSDEAHPVAYVKLDKNKPKIADVLRK